MIDYYLKENVSGVVTLEILDPAGEVIRKYSSDEKPAPVDPDKLSIPTYWLRPREALSTQAGMHRWIWDLRPAPPANARGGGLESFFFGGRGATVLPGNYTVRLTVSGKSYSQPLVVKMDPRVK